MKFSKLQVEGIFSFNFNICQVLIQQIYIITKCTFSLNVYLYFPKTLYQNNSCVFQQLSDICAPESWFYTFFPFSEFFSSFYKIKPKRRKKKKHDAKTANGNFPSAERKFFYLRKIILKRRFYSFSREISRFRHLNIPPRSENGNRSILTSFQVHNYLKAG